jgi:SAM-dependent methyltransferase
MSYENIKDFYNRQYRSYNERRMACPNAIHDLGKAQRRVTGVLRGFGINSLGRESEILDVGCGLGFYTKALALTGGSVTGLDFSEAAIESAREKFPECRFVKGAWPQDVSSEPRFALIWMVNFSLMNTFDVDIINRQHVAEAVKRLKPGGHLVVGWNSDFSGRIIDGYSHWPIRMIAEMQGTCGMSAPLVTEVRTLWLSWFLIRAAHLKRRSIPIFMSYKKSVSPSRE